MKSIRIIGFIVSFIVFIVLFFFITNLTSSSGDTDKKQIIVAKEEIPAMSVITPDMLISKEVSNDSISSDFVVDESEIVGMVANTKILLDEPILSQKLTPPDSSTLGIAPSIEEGKRGVSVLVAMDTGLSGLLRSGNYVDVIASYEVEGTPDPNAIKNSVNYENGISIAIAQNAKVIALAQITQADKQNEIVEEATGEDNIYGTVTLEVSAAEALRIASAETNSKCKIILILRSQNDRNIMDIPGQIPGTLMY